MPGVTRMTRKQRQAYEALLEHIVRSGFRVGDQLESYAELARHLGFSVTLLQRVIPMLAKDGYLSVVRRVGTFVQKLPERPSRAPAVAGGSPRLRVFVAESARLARGLWREIIAAFEARHRRIRVQLSMGVEEMGPVAGADIVVVDSHRAQQMASSLIRLPPDGWPAGSELLGPVACEISRTSERTSWPVMLGATLLYANQKLLSEAGMFEPDAWKTPIGVLDACERYFQRIRCREGLVFGWALQDAWAPLFYLGFGRARLDSIRDELERYVRFVAESPPPVLVTLADVDDPMFQVELLREGKALFVTGYFWQRPFAEPPHWAVLPPPMRDCGVPLMNAMEVGIRKGTTHLDEALTFAHFLASVKVQAIIASFGGLLPIRKAEARRHRLWHIYERQIARGWPEQALDQEAWRNSQAMRIASSILEIRSHGLEWTEFLRRVLAYEPGEFPIVLPGAI